ncbi:hypothetical protein P7K49_026409, partial [Saguinus oedipus]
MVPAEKTSHFTLHLEQTPSSKWDFSPPSLSFRFFCFRQVARGRGRGRGKLSSAAQRQCPEGAPSRGPGPSPGAGRGALPGRTPAPPPRQGPLSGLQALRPRPLTGRPRPALQSLAAHPAHAPAGAGALRAEKDAPRREEPEPARSPPGAARRPLPEPPPGAPLRARDRAGGARA